MASLLKKITPLIFSLVLLLSFASPIQAQDCPAVDVDKAIDLANRWLGEDNPGDHKADEWIDTVISQSCAAGIDPNFTISVWLHESGASNYTGICEKLGKSDPSAEYCQWVQDFGINSVPINTTSTDGVNWESHFQDQLSAFLNLPGYYADICPCDSMFSFFSKFRTGSSCTPTCGDIQYLEKIMMIFGWLTKNPDPSQFPSYPIESMSESCPLPEIIDSCSSSFAGGVNFDVHPLRQFPDDPIGSANVPLTTYCAMRPVAVELNKLPIYELTIDLKTVGKMKLDFSSFITPLLSVTDPKSPDYQLDFNDKAQRYLLDFLEGRAYYEPNPEATNPNPEEERDIWNRLGVFRKMAPKSYQDQLKRAVIQRASKSFNPSAETNPYGFEPASNTLHNYVVSYWDYPNHEIAKWETHTPITLQDFENNWAPLLTDFETTEEYQQAYQSWQIKDFSMWSTLWPYVPMFTREDSQGTIQIIDDTGLPGPQLSDTNSTKVTHPHLARAYEVSTALSYLLSPTANHQEESSNFQERWFTPAPWWSEFPWWMYPVIKKPHSVPFEPGWGPICDFKDNIPLISTSGDKAFDGTIHTSVNRQDFGVKNKKYKPQAIVSCGTGTMLECATCEEKVERIPFTYPPQYQTTYTVNNEGCYYYKDVFYTPNYLVTRTPYLKEILNSLFQSKRAVFNILTPFNQSDAQALQYEKTDWPGIGNLGEASPEYTFNAASGERSSGQAGYHRPGDTQSYLYRYLGNIQCAKEKVLSVLQPFFLSSSYTPYASECFETDDDDAPKPYPGNAICHFEREDLPFSNASSNPIAHRAWEIVSDLYQGFWCYWNRSPIQYDTDEVKYPNSYPQFFDKDLYEADPFPVGGADDYNMFWCTQLIVTTFNEKGTPFPGRNSAFLGTQVMANYFKDNGRYLEVPDSGGFNIGQVSPGDAIFFKIPNDNSQLNHVAIVYSVTNDGITTVESNTGYKTMFYPFDQSTGTFQLVFGEIKVQGFGKQ